MGDLSQYNNGAGYAPSETTRTGSTIEPGYYDATISDETEVVDGYNNDGKELLVKLVIDGPSSAGFRLRQYIPQTTPKATETHPLTRKDKVPKNNREFMMGQLAAAVGGCVDSVSDIVGKKVRVKVRLHNDRNYCDLFPPKDPQTATASTCTTTTANEAPSTPAWTPTQTGADAPF